MTDIPIVVFTCDKYAYIVPICLKYLERAWPTHPAVEVVTNTLPIDTVYPVTYLGPDRGWCANMLQYVEGKTEPFLLLCEEGILNAVDLRLLDKALSLARRPDVGLVRLYPCPGPTLPTDDPDIGEFDKTQPYAISNQVSIWNPQVYRDLMRAEDGIRDWELEGSRRARGYNALRFFGTYQSALSYKEYTRGGQPNPDALDWIARNP